MFVSWGNKMKQLFPVLILVRFFCCCAGYDVTRYYYHTTNNVRNDQNDLGSTRYGFYSDDTESTTGSSFFTTTPFTTSFPFWTTSTSSTTRSPFQTSTSSTTRSPFQTSTSSTTRSPFETSTTEMTTRETTMTPVDTTMTPTETTTVNVTTMTPTETTDGTTTISTTTVTGSTPTLPPNPQAPTVPWNTTYEQRRNLCIMAQLATKVTFQYRDRYDRLVTSGVDIPRNATVDNRISDCPVNTTRQVLGISFSQPHRGFMVLTFDKNDNESVVVSDINVNFIITESLFPNINSSYLGDIVYFSSTNLSLFDAQQNHSFSCNSKIKSNFSLIEIQDRQNWLSNTDRLIDYSEFEISKIKVQAFMPSDRRMNKFMSPNVCLQDQENESSVIPLTVGAILIGVVVTALIGYSIGRSTKRRPKRHYVAM